jgi:hypothetical protein
MNFIFQVVITLLIGGGVAPPDANLVVEVTCTNTDEGTQSVEFGPEGGTDQLEFTTLTPNDVDCTVEQTETAGAIAVEIDPESIAVSDESSVYEVTVRNTFPEAIPLTPLEPAAVEVEPSFTG